MQIILCCIGKTDDPRLQELIQQYAMRLSHYTKFELVCLPDIKQRKSLSVNEQKEREGSLFLKHIPDKEQIVLLDDKGKTLDSAAFAQYVSKKQMSGSKRIWFLIGGPYGFPSVIYDRATEKLSLSRMTFSHQMIRLLFVEQLYRAHTILKNEPYHHS